MRWTTSQSFPSKSVSKFASSTIACAQAYVDGLTRFILFHQKRHPAAMGAQEVSALLAYLAVERQVSASTQLCQSFVG